MQKSIDLKLLGYFVASFIFMELLLKVLVKNPLLSADTVVALLFTAMYGLIIFILCSLFTAAANRWLGLSALILGAVIFSSQYIYFSFFKTYYSFYSARNGSQIFQFWKEILWSIGHHFIGLILFFVPAVLFLIFSKKWFHFLKINFRTVLLNLSCVSILYGGAIGLIHLLGKDTNSPFDLYYQSNNKEISVTRFGLLTSMRIDMQRQLTDWSPILAKQPAAEPVPELPGYEPDSGEVKDEKSENLEDDRTAFDPQVLLIPFDELIANEKNKTIKKMHQYFSSLQPTQKNEFTGKFKGYNLIFLTAEGFSTFAIDPSITPTLYKMVHEGYQFPNFYTPIWEVSTSDGEYVATTGLLPKSGVWSFYESSENEMPFVMGNQLKKLGYKTVAYHNHTYDYYRRDVSHPNMGYVYKGLGNGLKVKETWPESDLEMMEVTIPEYIHDEPFHAYYMTVSGHLLYNFSGNYIAYKNKKYVENLPYSDEAKAYLATQIELDKALEYLLEQLEKNGLAGRTLIALSADHYPYGLDKETIDELAGRTVEENFELYKNTFILYAKGMEKVVVDDPASSLDIIPTLSNLFGLEYDSRLLMGRDLFSDSEPLVIFLNRSFITDKGFYNAVSKKFTPIGDAEVDDNYIKRYSAIVNNKFYYSTKILENDYYSRLVPSDK